MLLAMRGASQAQTIEVTPLSVRADLGSIDDDKRTVSLIFSTGAPVDRMDYWSGKRFREVLSLKPGHVQLERLNAGAPLLDSHSAWSVSDILGAVEPGSARIEKGQALATVRFSKREAVQPIWEDVRGGIIQSGHFVAEEKPQDVLAALVPFLRQ